MKAHTLVLSLALLACAAPAQSQQAQQYEEKSGPFTVYYSLFPSTFITPDVAAAYDLTRGKNKAVLNVSVRKTLPDGSDQEQTAIVSGHHSDLIHKTPLQFTEIREQGAIYYLAQITITGSPILYFDLQVQPDPNSSAIPITFKQQLFPD
jgi:hypothetical protein